MIVLLIMLIKPDFSDFDIMEGTWHWQAQTQHHRQKQLSFKIQKKKTILCQKGVFIFREAPSKNNVC